MSILYKKESPSQRRSLPAGMYDRKRLAAELVPAGNGWIDVVKEFPWTLTPSRSEAIKQTPFILLNEYYMVQSALNQQLLPYGLDLGPNVQGSAADLVTLAGSTFDADIDRLYGGIFDLLNPSDFKYQFPLFTPEHYSTSNSWEKKDILDTILNFQKAGLGVAAGVARFGSGFLGRQAAIGAGAADALNSMQAIPDIVKQMTLLKLQSQNPAVGLFDAPQLWQGSSPREYGFSFFLYNTEPQNSSDRDVQNLILRNWELCYLLTYQNSFNKRNFFTGLPPVFYEVIIPGVHYCKASVMKNINISNVGNVRNLILPIDGGPAIPVNVPDAYRIEITLQDVLMPSKNLLEGVIDKSYRQEILQRQ